jgi:hypothetical protein
MRWTITHIGCADLVLALSRRDRADIQLSSKENNRRIDMTRSIGLSMLASAAFMALGLNAASAQQAPQSPNMTFFVTSAGSGKGADLGGLEGADRQCQELAQAAGAGAKTWRAYLSTQAVGGAQAVNARSVAERQGRGGRQGCR